MTKSIGVVNINPKTKIHYGVINQNKVLEAWADSSEADYPKPGPGDVCDNCNETFAAHEALAKLIEVKGKACDDFQMESGPIGFHFEAEGYFAAQSEPGQDFGDVIMVTESSYYTYARECSPCFPNAGDLDSPARWQLVRVAASGSYIYRDYSQVNTEIYADPMRPPEDTGLKTYCFGHDWFEDGKAPYPVYRVDTNELVEPVIKQYGVTFTYYTELEAGSESQAKEATRLRAIQDLLQGNTDLADYKVEDLGLIEEPKKEAETKNRELSQEAKVPASTTTTIFGWECKCKHNYIHGKNIPGENQFNQKECVICHAKEQDMPDARVFEILPFIYLELASMNTGSRTKETKLRIAHLQQWVSLIEVEQLLVERE